MILYYLLAGPQRNVHDIGGTGISAPLYYMIGLASFGTMAAMLSCGGRIATERAAGWNRQLRISPLSTRSYFRAKVLTAYMMALITLLVLYAAGTSLGVSLAAGEWLEMTGLMLVGLIPFAALGILIGHLLTPDSIGPAIGGGIAVLAFLGGVWFPIAIARFHLRRWAGAAVLLARAGQPRGRRRARVANRGMARDHRLDGRSERARRVGLPQGHRSRVARSGARPRAVRADADARRARVRYPAADAPLQEIAPRRA